jgi:hypothetical protein
MITAARCPLDTRMRKSERLCKTTRRIVEAPLFWIELFDHTLQTIDSNSCRDIEEPVAVYAHFVA